MNKIGLPVEPLGRFSWNLVLTGQPENGKPLLAYCTIANNSA